MDRQLVEYLNLLAEKYENETFLKDDPSWFMHQVEGWNNQETMAFIASCFSYGSRKQFFPKIQLFLQWSGGDIYRWVRNGDFIQVISDEDKSFYRLQTCHNVLAMMSRLQELLLQYGSISAYIKPKASDTISSIDAICEWFRHSDNGALVPANAISACKRVCMFLRWMVRDSSPVDLGLWSDFIDKRTLIMPLDTHVVQEAIKLGLLTSKSASMSNAMKLSQKMKEIFPDDPLKGDFALFGLGVDHP